MNVVLAKPALECFDRGAGTHTELPRSAMHGMDSRFHGNDIDLLRLLANYSKLDSPYTRIIRLMAETFQNLMLGFSVALSPTILVYAFIGCIIGTLVGMMPGLGPLAGISLLLPATFGLNPIIAIVLLSGVYYRAMHGGSSTSILVCIPGEAASVMTCIDG